MRIVVILLVAANVLLFGFGIYLEYLADHWQRSGFAQKPSSETETAGTPSPSTVSSTTRPASDLPLNWEPSGAGIPPAESPAGKTETAAASPAAAAPAASPTTPNARQTTGSPIPPPAAPVSAVKEPAEERLACVAFGPILRTHIPRLKNLIGPLPADAAMKVTIRPSSVGLYWVYLSAASDVADRQQQIRMLNAKGINDYFIVQPDGASPGAISLGIFKFQESAQKLQQSLINKGIDAQLGQRQMGSTFVEISNAPASIAKRYALIRKQIPSIKSAGLCQQP